jgi:transcriptional regulator with XRE-family HTH domain
MGTKEAVGPHIRQLRSSLGKTQEELAEAAGISRDGLARIERAERFPEFSTLANLADALGVRVEEIWRPEARPVASRDALRLRRVQVALAKVPSAYADTVVDSVEALCSQAARLQSRPALRAAKPRTKA